MYSQFHMQPQVNQLHHQPSVLAESLIREIISQPYILGCGFPGNKNELLVRAQPITQSQQHFIRLLLNLFCSDPCLEEIKSRLPAAYFHGPMGWALLRPSFWPCLHLCTGWFGSVVGEVALT